MASSKTVTIQDVLHGVKCTVLTFDFKTEGDQMAFHYAVLPQILYDGVGARAKVATNEPEKMREVAKTFGGVEIAVQNF